MQDKIIPFFRESPFYLTGGTALSRGYFNHRYSDDLDYFVNDFPDFERASAQQIEKLGGMFGEITVVLKEKNFCRLFVGSEKLKIEMVNDVPSHIGANVRHPVLGLIDSKENILANKITALVDRSMPKDIVDIYFLSKDGMSLKKALTDAGSKAAGISPLMVAKIFAEFDYDLLAKEIKWVNAIPCDVIRDFMNRISIAIVEGRVE